MRCHLAGLSLPYLNVAAIIISPSSFGTNIRIGPLPWRLRLMTGMGGSFSTRISRRSDLILRTLYAARQLSLPLCRRRPRKSEGGRGATNRRSAPLIINNLGSDTHGSAATCWAVHRHRQIPGCAIQSVRHFLHRFVFIQIDIWLGQSAPYRAYVHAESASPCKLCIEHPNPGLNHYLISMDYCYQWRI
ncbi:hypothetical protein LX32DRAFT_427711 [Colletotrichum zoysiae]|uniref:Uncharacterized protein n=1 Tax=Colletotrichum zoysiae TaxID=1216348 RepID=A0AAD9HFK1_9PEZI|nr:hypothetical protein LX32DRAFT_427711 [Colletotrichum zoysiae]